MIKVAIGQDSHRFETEDITKPLILGGVFIPNETGLEGNSDADVILHALTNAVSGITTVNILGAKADELCLKEGIKDSSVYLKKSLEYLGNHKIVHVSFSIEAQKPKLADYIPKIREKIAQTLNIPLSGVAMTATTGERLTDFGRGLGMQVFVVLTADYKE
ncbi:MAG: 2-C-methyl-D-erythritol 2,4-cyclodiphosphate synthase [Chitinispirillales bacterium]|jgi:2-C-methyl-D-erythritol 2,4-cyclodiphosphate synthase|nr:2-C-methyl-D-erythritol 2,4-cyclodiphosphate synthase [Chitinispirillales bacterium]